MKRESLEELVYDAFVFGLPIYELARTRHNDLNGVLGAPPLAPNTARHGRSLSGADDRWITTPNNDTLYSRAWLDLSGGPVTVTVDAQPRGRYWSVALMDASTRHFALLGQRLHGAGPARITLAGPRGDASNAKGPAVHAPSNDVWLLARWIVDGEQDLPEARAMQDRMSITTAAGTTPCRIAPTSAMDPENFLAVLAEQLARNPPTGQDAERANRLASVGVQPGGGHPWDRLPAEVRDAWTAGVEPAHRRVLQTFIEHRRQVDGWWVPENHLEDEAAAYEWRAGVALAGLGALEPIEAVYAVRTTDDTGKPLHGQHRYRLTVPPSGIPAGSFWSISLYELMPDGRRFFARNPIGRHSIGDRTPGLRHEPDGSLVVTLQHRAPDDARERANWLPLPAAAPFALTLRAYHPSEALRRWAVPLPKMVRVD